MTVQSIWGVNGPFIGSCERVLGAKNILRIAAGRPMVQPAISESVKFTDGSP